MNPSQYKINILKSRQAISRQVEDILSELHKLDAEAVLLSLPNAMASRDRNQLFWDGLPDEQDGIQFESIEQQTAFNMQSLIDVTPDTKVTLHFGWDVVAFSCTFLAAWQVFQVLQTTSAHHPVDTHNCCIYPDLPNWYIIRAGENLYPMVWDGDDYSIQVTNGKK